MTITKIITIAATVATLAFGTAQAQEVPTIQIDTVGVDFANAASVDQLKSRIEQAAKQVCGVGRDRELNLQALARACYTKTIANAEAKIDRQVASSETKPGNTLAINTK